MINNSFTVLQLSTFKMMILFLTNTNDLHDYFWENWWRFDFSRKTDNGACDGVLWEINIPQLFEKLCFDIVDVVIFIEQLS